MLSLRPAFRSWSYRVPAVRRTAPSAFFSTKKDDEVMTTEEAEAALEAEKSPAQRYVEKISKTDSAMVFGSTDGMPDPKLPENPAEIATLDPAHFRDQVQPNGVERTVHIRQEHSRVVQGPESVEKTWIISFQDEGEGSQTWDNPLMGWVSGADPMASNIQTQLTFRTASDAVYFAKKRGWKFIVETPIYRDVRDDDAQYQDNFLPQAVAAAVAMDRTQCDHWSRPKSGTSHYFRPLKYHGDGTVNQYGPNPKAPIEPHVEGYYKMR